MFKTPIASAALLALALTAGAPAQAAATDHGAERAAERQQQNFFKAWFPDLATARKAAVSLHGQMLEVDYAKGWQVFQLDAEGQALLQRFGYRLEPATDFIARRNSLLDAVDAAAARDRAANPNAPEAGVFAIPNYSCYETVEETFAAAQAMAASRPDLATWTDVGDSWQKSVNKGGYDMGVLKLSNSAVPGPKPKLFVSSAIHAREYVTAPLSLAFARWLFDGYGTNADATWLMDQHEVHLLLQTNPDGRKKAEAGLLWRKNTNTNYCGARSNNRGADLNRNFAFSWNTTNGQGSSGNACDETFRGPSAASEPEVQSVQNYIRNLWPDLRGPGKSDPAPADTGGIHLDLHSYGELVLWPWGDTPTPSGNASAQQTLGRRFAFFNGYFPQQSIGLYPTDGTSDGPSYGELGVAAYTFELGTTFFQSCTDFSNTIKPRNLPALVYAAKVSRAPYQMPGGPDVTSLALGANGVPAGTPVALTAAITDTRFSTVNGTEPVQNIASAEAYIDIPPWANGAQPVSMTASDGAFNAPTENAQATLSTAGLADGRHIVFVRGIDTSGQAGPVSAVFLDIGVAPPPNITLSLAGSRVNLRTWAIDLSWAGAVGANVDIYLNGALLLATANDGAYRDQRGKGSWTYKVCQTGPNTACSPEQSITF